MARVPHGGGSPAQLANAGLVLGLGIGGLFIPLLAPVAWILGQIERNKIKRGEAAPNSAVTAGWLLGIIVTCGYALVVLFLLGLLGLIASAFS